jgi:hypothetical protein
MTPNHSSKKSLTMKSTTSKEFYGVSHSRTGSRGVARILFTDTSDKLSGRMHPNDDKLRRNPSAGRLYDSKRRSPSQPSVKKSHKKSLSNFSSI